VSPGNLVPNLVIRDRPRQEYQARESSGAQPAEVTGSLKYVRFHIVAVNTARKTERIAWDSMDPEPTK